MILLDTNVLSELMRPGPNENVVRWMDALPGDDIWISAVTVAEIRLGLALLPEGRRKHLLTALAEEMFREEFSEKCLPFDYQAAGEYAKIVSTRSRQGRPITVEDAQIAAIAISSGLELATRNTSDFMGIEGLNLINPWGCKDPHS
jgi:predicted nucleic acid-binding protein